MRKILIVAYHFPPDAAVGAVRPAKLAKYLPQFGWQPLILTVRAKYYSRTDASRLKDVAAVPRVYRTRVLPHLSNIYILLKTHFQRRRAANGSFDEGLQSPAAERTGLSYLRRLYLSLEGLPDDKRGWVWPATLVGLRIIATEKIDTILSTGPPMSCHLIGLLLKILTGRRWIADFRDPWLWHYGAFGVPSTALSKSVQAWLERKTITRADKLIFTTERMKIDLERRYPAVAGKTAVILNGYDPDDFDGTVLSTGRSVLQPFTLTHAGTMYYTRNAHEFLTTLARLIDSGAIPRTRVRVNFIGLSPNVRELSQQLGIDDVVSVIDTMSYRSCIECLRGSDVLLLFAQGQPLQIPTKLYDYIAVKRPILVLAGDGATADLAETLAGSIVVEPGDQKRLEMALRQLYWHFENHSHNGFDVATKQSQPELTKASLTRRLTELLN